MCTQTLWNNVHKHLLWETKAVKNENTTVCCDLHYLMSHMQSCLWFCINFISHDPSFIIWDCWILRQEYWPVRRFWCEIIYSLYYSFIPHNYSLSKPHYLSSLHANNACGCLCPLWDCRVSLDTDYPKQHLQHTVLHSASRQTQKSLKGPN